MTRNQGRNEEGLKSPGAEVLRGAP